MTKLISDSSRFIDRRPVHTDDPRFEPIWQAIKEWDIQRSPRVGYAGATGTDVQIILDALDNNSGPLSSPVRTGNTFRADVKDPSPATEPISDATLDQWELAPTSNDDAVVVALVAEVRRLRSENEQLARTQIRTNLFDQIAEAKAEIVRLCNDLNDALSVNAELTDWIEQMESELATAKRHAAATAAVAASGWPPVRLVAAVGKRLLRP